MSRLSLPLVLLALAAGGLPAVASPIINGSFEEPLGPPGQFVNYPAGSTAITGWTVVGVDSSVVNGTFVQNGITFNAQDGNQFLDLAGVTSNSQSSGVTQMVATTPGAAYHLSFYVGSATDNLYHFPSTVDLSIDGGPRVSFTNPAAPTDHMDWKLFTVSFTATGPATGITFYNGSAPSNYLGALDNVSLEPAAVTATPEPASLAMFAGMLLVGGAVARRRFAR